MSGSLTQAKQVESRKRIPVRRWLSTADTLSDLRLYLGRIAASTKDPTLARARAGSKASHTRGFVAVELVHPSTQANDSDNIEARKK